MPQVFVYGTLKTGGHNHHYLRNAISHGPATLTFKGKMFDVGFPVLMKSREKVKVEGELFDVDRATFAALDRLEGQGHMYKRKRKRLQDGRYAWVYIGMNKFWQPRAYGRPVTPNSDGTIRWESRR
jgi:gamma-glutamylaminecyclotransferase